MAKEQLLNIWASVREGVATEETGADYRAVTARLLADGMIATNAGTYGC